MLTVLVFVSGVLVSSSYGCAALPGPDTNSTQSSSKTAQIKLTVSPPLEWTAPVTGQTGAQGQAESKAEAEKAAKRIIDNAIRSLLISHQFAVDAVTWTTSYTADQISVGDCKDAAGTATHGAAGDNVMYVCKADHSGVEKEYEVVITIDLVAQVPVVQTQWDNMTSKLGDKLDTKGIEVKSIVATLKTA